MSFLSRRESAVRLVVTAQAERLEVTPVEPPLPAAVRLYRVDVVNFHRQRAAFLAAIADLLHLRLARPLPISRSVEAQVLRVPFLVVASVPFLLSLFKLHALLFLGYGLAAGTVGACVRDELAAAGTRFKEQCGNVPSGS